MGLVAEQGRALVIAVNKWDGIAPDQRDAIRDGLDLRLDFLRFAPVHFISARHGTGVGELMELGAQGVSRRHARDADQGTHARARAGASRSTSRRSCAAGASSCAMRTRAAAIRRSS